MNIPFQEAICQLRGYEQAVQVRFATISRSRRGPTGLHALKSLNSQHGPKLQKPEAE